MPYKDKETAKGKARERQRKHRQGVTGQGVTNGNALPVDGVALARDLPRLFTPSKFLTEEDLRVEQQVRESLSKMDGARLSAFRGLSNTFTPNRA